MTIEKQLELMQRLWHEADDQVGGYTVNGNKRKAEIWKDRRDGIRAVISFLDSLRKAGLCKPEGSGERQP